MLHDCEAGAIAAQLLHFEAGPSQYQMWMFSLGKDLRCADRQARGTNMELSNGLQKRRVNVLLGALLDTVKQLRRLCPLRSCTSITLYFCPFPSRHVFQFLPYKEDGLAPLLLRQKLI